MEQKELQMEDTTVQTAQEPQTEAAEEELLAAAEAPEAWNGETAAEASAEEPGMEADAEASAENKKQKKIWQRLFVRRSVMEWVSTLSLCALVMYMGYALMTAMQSGSTGKLLLDTFSSINMDIRMVLLIAVVALAATVARKRVQWLAVPAGLGIALCVWEIWVPAVIVFGLAKGLLAGMVTMEEMIAYQATIMPYVLEFVIILCSILALAFTVAAALTGRCRPVSVVFWALWAVIYNCVILTNISDDIMNNLDYVAVCFYAVLLAFTACLPMVRGKRVAKSELAALQTEDELAYWLEKNSKKDRDDAAADAANAPAEETPQERPLTEEDFAWVDPEEEFDGDDDDDSDSAK